MACIAIKPKRAIKEETVEETKEDVAKKCYQKSRDGLKKEEKIELDRKKNRTPWYNVYFEEHGVKATKKQMQERKNEGRSGGCGKSKGGRAIHS